MGSKINSREETIKINMQKTSGYISTVSSQEQGRQDKLLVICQEIRITHFYLDFVLMMFRKIMNTS